MLTLQFRIHSSGQTDTIKLVTKHFVVFYHSSYSNHGNSRTNEIIPIATLCVCTYIHFSSKVTYNNICCNKMFWLTFSVQNNNWKSFIHNRIFLLCNNHISKYQYRPSIQQNVLVGTQNNSWLVIHSQ